MSRRNGLALTALLARAIASPYLRHSVTIGLGNNKFGLGGTTGSPQFWYHLMISVLLVLIGGLFAGWVSLQERFLFFDYSAYYFVFPVWRLVLWDWMNSIFVCWLLHRRIQKRSRTHRKVRDLRGTGHCNWLIIIVLNLLRFGRHWVLVVSGVDHPTLVVTTTDEFITNRSNRFFYSAMWFVEFRVCLFLYYWHLHSRLLTKVYRFFWIMLYVFPGLCHVNLTWIYVAWGRCTRYRHFYHGYW